jgi:hypothetical protein
MIGNPKGLFDQAADPWSGPAIGFKTGGECTPLQQTQQHSLLRAAEFGWPARPRAPSQSPYTPRRQASGPVADGSTADVQFASDFGLRQITCSEQAGTCQAPFFKLFGRESPWSIAHALNCKAIYVTRSKYRIHQTWSVRGGIDHAD